MTGAYSSRGIFKGLNLRRQLLKASVYDGRILGGKNYQNTTTNATTNRTTNMTTNTELGQEQPNPQLVERVERYVAFTIETLQSRRQR
jgi:hypothetical protein